MQCHGPHIFTEYLERKLEPFPVSSPQTKYRDRVPSIGRLPRTWAGRQRVSPARPCQRPPPAHSRLRSAAFIKVHQKRGQKRGQFCSPFTFLFVSIVAAKRHIFKNSKEETITKMCTTTRFFQHRRTAARCFLEQRASPGVLSFPRCVHVSHAPVDL